MGKKCVSHIYTDEAKPVSTAIDTVQLVAANKNKRARYVSHTFPVPKSDVKKGVSTTTETPVVSPATEPTDSAMNTESGIDPDSQELPSKRVCILLLTYGSMWVN